MNGFFKLQRRFFSHALWEEEREFSRAEAFLDLLQLAAYAHNKKIVKGSLITLKPGELCGSERYLSGRWKWSAKKVRTYLTLLEADGMIDVQKKREGSIITLCNYSKYANDEAAEEAPKKRQPSHRGSTEEAPRKRNKEGEEEKEREEGKGRGVPPTDDWDSPQEQSTKPLCTLQQAIDHAPICKMTPEQAEHWWHNRNKAGWTMSSASGHPRKITSWQSDMVTSLSWVGESAEKAKHAVNGKTKKTGMMAAEMGLS